MGQNGPSIAPRPLMYRHGHAIFALTATLGVWTAGRLAAHFQTSWTPSRLKWSITEALPPLNTAGPHNSPDRRRGDVTIQLDPPPDPVAPENSGTPNPATPHTTGPLKPDQPRRDTKGDADIKPPHLPPSPHPLSGIHGSGWILIRPDRARNGIAPQGQLGASQMGVRLLLPLDELVSGLSLSLRLSSNVSLSDGREAALGLDLARPFGLPLALVAEERLPIEKGAQARPALMVIGGLYDHPLADRLSAEGYVQAGSVGLRHPLWFADGRLTLTKALGASPQSPRLGAGLWGGAQTGLARLDLGPTLVIPAKTMRISFDWRFRVAGTARPASGPSLTLGKDF